MAAIVAFHHGITTQGIAIDKYRNDPFVWSRPFLWSHCHARRMPSNFGSGIVGPTFKGHDVVFFVHLGQNNDVFCDCVFVIDHVNHYSLVEATYVPAHPSRHYHFDVGRFPAHANSNTTYIANNSLSFLPSPPVQVTPWIDSYLHPAKMSLKNYLVGKGRKSHRVVDRDANKVYDIISNICAIRVWQAPGNTLSVAPPLYPIPNIVINYALL